MPRGKDDLPSNVEVEKTVLGAALVNIEALYKMTSLEMVDFSTKKHQTIFKAIMNMFQRKTPIDVYTAAEELTSMNELENIGGVAYLQELADSVISFSNIQSYIDIINDESTLRKMLVCIRSIDKKYRENDIKNPNEFILESEAAFKDSISHRKIGEFKTAKDLSNAIGTALADSPMEDMLAGEEVTGFNSGYRSINKYTSGFQRGEVTIVAARPSVGKTTLAMNFAYHVASKSHVPVVIFSLEMSADALIKRLISSVSCVSLKTIMNGRLGRDKEARRKVAGACTEIASLPLYIDDTSSNRVLDIVAKTRKLMATTKDIGLVVIDYLGLIQGGSSDKESKESSRQEEVRKISLQLKAMARDLKVPVVVVSQLSRDSEKRGDSKNPGSKKPMLSDLRDSGSIEQDADVVMLLYRSDYYDNGETKQIGDKKGGKLSESDKYTMVFQQQKKELMDAIPAGAVGSTSLVEVNVAKNRNGATGRAYLFFYKEYSRFDQPSIEWEKAVRELDEKTEKGI